MAAASTNGNGRYPDPAPALAVVVPATDHAVFLDACLASLQEARGDTDEIFVVRDASAPPLPAGAVLVAHIADSGPAAARNAGALMTSADVLVFVDADVVVAPDFLDRIRATFAARPDLDGVFGAYDDDVRGARLVSAFRNLLHHHVHHSAAGPATTFWTGLGAIRRSTFVAVGGLDETLRFLEDIELGARLQEAGATIELDPRLAGGHLKGYTLLEMVRTDLLERGVPWVRLILSGRASARALNAGVHHRIGAGLVLAGLTAAAARRPAPAASFGAAFLMLNRDFHALLRRRLGWRGALAGPPLHALHLAMSSLAVPLGIASHLLRQDRAAEPRKPRTMSIWATSGAKTDRRQRGAVTPAAIRRP